MGMGTAVRLAQDEDDLGGFARRNVEVNLEGGAAVRPGGAGASPQVPVQQAFRAAGIVL